VEAVFSAVCIEDQKLTIHIVPIKNSSSYYVSHIKFCI